MQRPADSAVTAVRSWADLDWTEAEDGLPSLSTVETVQCCRGAAFVRIYK